MRKREEQQSAKGWIKQLEGNGKWKKINTVHDDREEKRLKERIRVITVRVRMRKNDGGQRNQVFRKRNKIDRKGR